MIKKDIAPAEINPEENGVERDREVVLDFIGEKKKKESSVFSDINVEETKKKGGQPADSGKKEKSGEASGGSGIKLSNHKKQKKHSRIRGAVYHTAVFGLVLFFVLYSGFIFLVISFRIDNSAFRIINKFLPAPALVSKDIFVDYYRYKDESENGLVKDLIAKKEKGMIGGKIWSFVD